MPLNHRQRTAVSAFALLLLAYAKVLVEESRARRSDATRRAASFTRALRTQGLGAREEAQRRLEGWTQAQLESFGVDWRDARGVAHAVPPSPPRGREGEGEGEVKLSGERRGVGDARLGGRARFDVDALCATGEDIVAELNARPGEAGRFDMNALLALVGQVVGGPRDGAGARAGTLGRAPVLGEGGG